jgi:hypothetical protein
VSARQRFKPQDVVELEVAEFGERELFAWPGQTDFEDKDGQILGLSSSGEFYSHLKSVMAGPAAIHYVGQEDCQGRPCARFDFQLGQSFANWTLSTGAGRGLVAEGGSFWADPQSSTLYRLVVNAEDIPIQLGIRAAALDIRYGPTILSPNRPASQLPQNFTLSLTMISGAEQLNTTAFTHCREYGAESKVVADATAAATPAKRIQEIALPARLPIELSLTTPVRSSSSRVGDRLEAVTDRDLRSKGRLYLPRGAHVSGRVRRMEHYSEPTDYWIAAVEFTDIVFALDGNTVHARFTGSLESYDPVPGLKQEIATEKMEHVDLGGNQVDRIHRESLFTRQLPGVGTFLLRGPTLTLAKGFHMTWITTAIVK